MSLMTHQDFQVYAIIINHSYNAKMDEFDILVSLILSQTHLCLLDVSNRLLAQSDLPPKC